MELYFHRNEEWKQWYNCSHIDIESVPLETRRGHPIASMLTLILTTIYYALYLPCMLSLWKHQKDGNTCYRLLFYGGVCDLSLLWSLGFLTGIMGLQGAVYCTHPLLLYFSATIHDCFFVSETLSNFVLAINRCLDIVAPEMARVLFEGKKIWLWLGGISAYGIYWLIFVPPPVFSSIFFAYYFNPFMGYINDEATNDKYNPLIHKLHDMIVGCGLPVVYVIFLIALKWKMRGAVSGLGINRLQLMSFLQVLVLSFLHIFGGILYVSMQKMEVGYYWPMLGQFTWFHIHALPPVIFLVMNRTVRNDCIVMFHRVFNPSRVRRMHGVTVLDPKSGLPVSSTAGSQNTGSSKVGTLPPVRGGAVPRAKEEF